MRIWIRIMCLLSRHFYPKWLAGVDWICELLIYSQMFYYWVIPKNNVRTRQLWAENYLIMKSCCIIIQPAQVYFLLSIITPFARNDNCEVYLEFGYSSREQLSPSNNNIYLFSSTVKRTIVVRTIWYIIRMLKGHFFWINCMQSNSLPIVSTALVKEQI